MNLNNLKWNVYYWDINANELESFNIFEHGGFREDLERMLKNRKIRTLNSFKKRLREILGYYFWGKCEWEIIIDEFPPRRVYNCTVEGNVLTIHRYYGGEKLNYLLDSTDFISGFYPENGNYYLQNKKDNKSTKIDVYEQIRMNFDLFAEYIVKTTGKRYKKEEEDDD